MIHLISASHVARIAGVSHRCPAISDTFLGEKLFCEKRIPSWGIVSLPFI
jgi:hypothetical protein